MGFYNYLFYKFIKKIFYFLKYNFKKFVIILLLFLILFLNFNKSFASETVSNSTYYDAYNTLYNIYDNIYANIIFRLEKTDKAQREIICSYFSNTLYNNYICFGSGVNSPAFYDNYAPNVSNRINMRLYFVRDWSSDGTQGRDTVFSDYVNWMNLGNVTATKIIYKQNTETLCFQSYNGNEFSSSFDVSSINDGEFVWISKPTILYDYPSFFIDYLNNVRLGLDNTSLLTELQQMGDTLQNIDDELSEMNDFLQNENTTPITNSSLPSDDMQNVTSEGFNSVFTKLYNAFTIDDGTSGISITIPYLNYTFMFRKNYLKNALLSSGMGPIIDLITAFYYFIVSRFIVKDISKYIDEFKNGNISKTETNIKADML